MDRFLLMSVFVAVAEEESFAGGARRLGMSPPAVKNMSEACLSDISLNSGVTNMVLFPR